MKLRRLICLVLAVFMVLSMTACGDKKGDADSPTAVKDTLTVGRSGEPKTMIPLTHSDGPSVFSSGHLYDKLVYNNEETGTIEPRLAEKWERLDDKTIRFYLRKDVKSHAGDPFTASDVIFTIQQAKQSTHKAYIWRPFDFDACKVVDDYTVDIVTKEPYSASLVLLSTEGAAMMVEKSYKDVGGKEENDRFPKCGTGPYVLKEWVAGDRVIFERNENYWGEKPAFKNLVIRNITDDTSRALALESGDIDVCMDVLPAQVENLSNNPNIDIMRNPNFATEILGLNCQHGPLKDVRVRQALCYALDIPNMVKLAYANVGSPADGMMSPAMSDYCPPKADEVYHLDINKAKELLKEAGYENGFEINLWTNEKQSRVDLTEMIRNSWEKIGVKANIQIMEFATFLSKLDKGEHDAYILGWNAAANDGDFLHDTFHSKMPWHDNMPGYKNPRLDELVDKARCEMDNAKKKEYYAEFQSIIRKELPVIPIQHGETIDGLKNTLTGYVHSNSVHVDTIRPKTEAEKAQDKK